jgi:two-component system sensor histidine kinase QseC
MKSIRTYLVVIIVSVICLSNFVAALQGYRDSLESADKLVDEQILERFDSLSVLIAKNIEVPQRLYNDNTVFQLWRGSVLEQQSGNSPDTLFADPNGSFHITSYRGHRWRSFGKPIAAGEASLIVASKYNSYSALTEEILLKAIVPIVWVLPIVGLLVLMVINLGLGPIKRLASSLANRETNDFSMLPTDGYPSELETIVSALNSLFFRLAGAFDRERRFSADAAHELRTPLAALKINLHNLAKELGDIDEIDVLKRATDRMEHCIEQLLEIHRTSIDPGKADLQYCDLNKLAREVIAEKYDSISARQQSIELMGGEASLRADPSALSVLLRNLIDNASKYSPQQGRICISTAEKAGNSSILVEDSGPGIPGDDIPRVLDRFYRVGGDRHNTDVPGSGLGLSIVSSIAQRYHGQILFSRSAELGGLAIEVLFETDSKKAGL